MSNTVEIALLIRAQTKQLQRDMNRMSRMLNKRFAKIRKQAAGVMKPLLGLISGGLLVRGIGRSVSAWGDFEKALSNVQAKTEVTKDRMVALRKEVNEVARTTQYTATQTAKGAGFLAMAGLDVDQIERALAPMLALASATDTTAQIAADVVTNIATPLGLLDSIEDLERVGDVIAKLTASANTDIVQMGEAMSYAAATLKPLNVSLEEGAALIGAVGDAGIKGSRAGTVWRQTLASIARGQIDVNEEAGEAAYTLTEQSRVLRDLGVSFRSADGQIKPFYKTLQDLVAAGADTTQFVQIFGTRAGTTWGAIIDRMERADQLKDALLDSKGVAEFMQMVQLDNLSGDVLIFKSNVEALRNAFYDSGVGTMARDVVQDLTQAISEMKPTIIKISKAMKIFVDMTIEKWGEIKDKIVEVKKALKSLRYFLSDDVNKTIDGTNQYVKRTAIAVVGVAAAWKVVSFILKRFVLPIVMLIASLFISIPAVIVAIGVLLLTFSKEITAGITSVIAELLLWPGIFKKRFEVMGKIITKLWDWIVDHVEYAVVRMKGFFTVLKADIEDMFLGVSNYFKGLMNDMFKQINPIIEKIEGVLSLGFKPIKLFVLEQTREEKQILQGGEGAQAKSGHGGSVTAPGAFQLGQELSDELEASNKENSLGELGGRVAGTYEAMMKAQATTGTLMDQVEDGVVNTLGRIAAKFGFGDGATSDATETPGGAGAGAGGAGVSKTKDGTTAEAEVAGEPVTMLGLFGTLLTASKVVTDSVADNFHVMVGSANMSIGEIFQKGGKRALREAQKLFIRFAKISKKAAKVAKVLAIGQAIIDTHRAVVAAWANAGGYPMGIYPAAATLAAGLLNIAEIKKANIAHSGITDIPKDGTWNLEKGERVLSKDLNIDLKSFLGSARETFTSVKQTSNVIQLHPRGIYHGEDIFDAFGDEEGTVILQSEVR